MPELPDVETYLACLKPRILGRPVQEIELKDPFVLRSVTPQPSEAWGRQVEELRRLGKRVVLGLEGELFLVIHLMIAGRLRWREPPSKTPPGTLVRLQFPGGALFLTEAGNKRRARFSLAQGEEALQAQDPGGLEPLQISLEAFSTVLKQGNHTLKRALTDPHLLAGIGNAYSDEILHRARLSPVTLTQKLGAAEMERLYQATQNCLRWWLEHLLKEAGRDFPEKVTAFRPEMAVHGRFGLPCPDCGTPVQRIRYADNETNYCPTCQTGGKLLADRSLSRLLKKDWPRSLEDLEDHLARRRS